MSEANQQSPPHSGEGGREAAVGEVKKMNEANQPSPHLWGERPKGDSEVKKAPKALTDKPE